MEWYLVGTRVLTPAINVKGVLLRAVSTTAQQVKTRATRCKSEVTWGTLCSPAVDAAQLSSLQNIAVVE